MSQEKIDGIVGRFIAASDKARNTFIDELRADNERLRALLTAKTTPGYELLGTTIEKLSARIDAKEAEIERLRAALAALAKHFGSLADNHMLSDEARECFRLARAALEPKP